MIVTVSKYGCPDAPVVRVALVHALLAGGEALEDVGTGADLRRRVAAEGLVVDRDDAERVAGERLRDRRVRAQERELDGVLVHLLEVLDVHRGRGGVPRQAVGLACRSAAASRRRRRPSAPCRSRTRCPSGARSCTAWGCPARRSRRGRRSVSWYSSSKVSSVSQAVRSRAWSGLVMMFWPSMMSLAPPPVTPRRKSPPRLGVPPADPPLSVEESLPPHAARAAAIAAVPAPRNNVRLEKGDASQSPSAAAHRALKGPVGIRSLASPSAGDRRQSSPCAAPPAMSGRDSYRETNVHYPHRRVKGIRGIPTES